MVCPNCGSHNVRIEMTQDFELKTKHKGLIYWLLIGWWWEVIKWTFFTIPALIIAIFKPRKQKAVTTTCKVALCQHCGHSWKVK